MSQVKQGGYEASSALGRVLGFALWEGVAGLKGPGLHRPPYYAAVYATKGRSRYRDAAGLECSIGPGDLIFVFPDFPVLYGACPGTVWSEFWITFVGPVFELWESLGVLDRAQPVHHLAPVDYWLRRFQSVMDPVESGAEVAGMPAVCRLQQVLSEALVAGARARLSGTQARWLARAKSLLESGPAQGFSLAAVARTLRTTAGAFRKRFTRVAGMPPTRYRDERLMERACRLLQEEGLMVKEVAYRLGYADEFHFSHKFKQVIGCCPSRVRRR